MRTTYIICAVIAVLGVAVYAEKKLQIGVKKRVDPEDCKIKSRKGDKLHMHYTVINTNLSIINPKKSTWSQI